MINSTFRILFIAATLAGSSFSATSASNEPARETIGRNAVSAFGLATEPTPAWVVAERAPTGSSQSNAPMYYALIDTQVRLSKDGAVRYEHIERVVTDTSALPVASQIEISFDPSYQSLVFHRVTIKRNGHLIDRLDKKYIRYLQRETKLEESMYDGQTSASIVLPDVRVGDRIEYSFSVKGANPVFEGKFADHEFFSAVKGPVDLYQYRLLYPEGRNVAYRVGPDVKVSSQTRDGQREVIFRRTGVPQFRFDPYAPGVSYLTDFIQFSEFRDWSEVAQWGVRLFEFPRGTDNSVRALAEEIKSASDQPLQRLSRALDFVQRDIRYFGVEIGSNTHRPVAPEKTLASRSGDCKDKVALLVALLKQMDIKAVPVLVSPRYLADVSDLLPSPLAFSHAIARVEVNGEVFWLDGTRAYQTGPLSGRQSVGLGKGLVLKPQETVLSELPSALGEQRMYVQDVIRFDKISEPPTLESRITYLGEYAEGMREVIAKLPFSQIETELATDYGRFYSGIQRTDPVSVEEVAGANALTIVQRFNVPTFLRFPEQKLLVGEAPFWSLVKVLQHPAEPQRKLPFRVQSPGTFRHRVEIFFPEDVVKADATASFNDDHPVYRYSADYKTTPRKFEFNASLAVIKDKVMPDEWSGYHEKLVKLGPRLAGYANVPAIQLSQLDKLNIDLQGLAKARPVAVTAVQRDANIRNLVLSAQLDSGRLSLRQRAEALHERGIQLDHLGKFDEAARDFAEAIKLDGETSANYSSAAVNAFARGLDDQAVEWARKSLTLSPSDTGPHQVWAFVEYYRGNYAEAKSHFLELSRGARNDTDKLYAVLWLYLSARRNGEDGAALVQANLPFGTSSKWPYSVIQAITGAASLDQVIREAKEGEKDPSRLCELYFYLGEKSSIDGDIPRARQYFRDSIGTGVVEFNEFLTSKRSLARLGK